MKTVGRVNARGLRYLKEWIEKTSMVDDAGPLHHTAPRDLDAWACEAEEAMACGDPPTVEMPASGTKSGVNERFTIPADGFEWEAVEA